MKPRFILLYAPDEIFAPLADAVSSPLGFRPEIRAAFAEQPAAENFVFPCGLEFGLFDRQALAERLAEERRRLPDSVFYHDDLDLGHTLVTQAFAEAAEESLAGLSIPQQRLGVLLAGVGEGDASSRAQVYRLMRLLWERLGAARGEVAFLRHPAPFLRAQLENLADSTLAWIVVPLLWKAGERYEHLRQIVADHLRARPDLKETVRVARPIGACPAMIGWLQHRILQLWRQRRQADAGRRRSAKSRSLSQQIILGERRTGLAADCRNAQDLRAILPAEVLDAETVLVKVTWHGYATGTYTDPVALDALLEAIPGKVVLLEGHTSSRNSAAAVDWSWEEEARQHRAWVRAQETEFLEKTGLAEVLRRRKAQYLNVTEAFWDEDAPDAAAFLPAVLRERAGAPLVSFARFKGPTRLSLSNLFGLLPEPLRARWHGPNITYFAKTCCDIARRYGEIFKLFGLVEGLNTAVRWDRRGLYRSRWGAYDLISTPGLATFSSGVVAADLLAARLQGQDVRRSAFYDVARKELGQADEAEALNLPEEWIRRFA